LIELFLGSAAEGPASTMTRLSASYEVTDAFPPFSSPRNMSYCAAPWLGFFERHQPQPPRRFGFGTRDRPHGGVGRGERDGDVP
jgi:hypothetical protein